MIYIRKPSFYKDAALDSMYPGRRIERIKQDYDLDAIYKAVGETLIEKSQDYNGNIDTEKLVYFLGIDEECASTIALMYADAIVSEKP